MKKLFLSIACLLLVHLVSAQNETLQFDENNKYVYYKVVDKPGTPADTLYQRSLNFDRKTEKGDQPNAVRTKGKLMVYTSSLASKKDAGEIRYILYIDTKDQKYRYKFSDFVFTPYKIDRYGNMVAVPGIDIPLEKLSGRYGKKDVDSYLEQTTAYCNTVAAQLKQHMDKTQLAKAKDTPKKIDTGKW